MSTYILGCALCLFIFTNELVLKFLLLLFRPRLKEHMQYCMSHPEEISKLSKLKAQITEVKGIMMDNIEKVVFLFFLVSGTIDF